MERVKKVFEGLWTGIVDRGTTGREKKEDVVHYVKMDQDDLKELMMEGIVHCVYRKKPIKLQIKKGEPGTIREAWGTKHFDSLPFPVPSMGGMRHSSGCLIYIDLEKENWRNIYEGIGAADKVYTIEEYESLSELDKAKESEKLLKAMGLWEDPEVESSEEVTAEPEVEKTPAE